MRRYLWLPAAGTTAWAAAANWDWGILSPANDLLSHIAVFEQGSYASQPNAGTTSVYGVYVAPASSSLTLSGTALTLGNVGFVSSGGNATTVSCPLTGSATITHNGTGTLTLSAANTHTGGTFIRSGTVSPAVAAALGGSAGAGAVTLGDTSGSASATLTMGASAMTLANPITVVAGSAGTKTIINSGASILSAAATISDALTVDTRGSTLTFSAAVSGAGNVTVQNSTVGTQANEFMALSTTSSGYTGTIIVTSSGAARSTAANAMQNALIQVNSGGIFYAGAATTNVKSLQDNAGAGGTVGASATTKAINLNATSGSTTFNGVLTNGGGTALSLLKAGASTQVLGGTNTYTGATTLNSTTGGTLQINGSLGATAVSWGASGNTTLAAPSSGSGTAALGGTLTGIATSRWSFPSASTTFSKFTVAGATTFSGGFCDFPAGITANGTYDLIVSTGAMSGALPSVSANSTGKTLVLSQSGNSLQVTVS